MRRKSSLRRKSSFGRTSSLAKIRRALARLVPVERQIIIRAEGRVRHIVLSSHLQMGGILLVAALLGWGGFATFSFHAQTERLAAKDAEIAKRQTAYNGLLREFQVSGRRFANQAGALEASHRQLQFLVEQHAALTAQASGGALDEAAEREGGADGQQRSDLARGPGPLAAAPNTAPNKGLKIQSDPKKTPGLDSRLQRLQSAQSGLLARLGETADSNIERIRAIVKRSGLNPDRLMARAGVSGAGGPFFPAGSRADGAAPMAVLESRMDSWQAMQDIMRRLPLASPVDQYFVASKFGRRRDPFNGRWAFHHGVDLAGNYGAPVRAPAPGVVVFAGKKGRYGKLIEIDHGLGIRTRYGHLLSISVKRGQFIDQREKIGRLGSTGRSTGPHVHYEIRVDGRARNPLKFLRAGRDVFKS